jgi:hypothetical protein
VTVVAVRDVIIVAFVVGVFLEDQQTAAFAADIVPGITPAAERSITVSLIVVPIEPLAAMRAEDRQFLQAVLAVDLLMKEVFFSFFQYTAAVGTDGFIHSILSPLYYYDWVSLITKE